MRVLLSALYILLGIFIAQGAVFDDVVDRIMANNADLKAKEARTKAQIQSFKAGNTLAAPEVEFSHLWGTNSDYGNRWSLGVSQSFDWPGVYVARREAAKACSMASELLLESDAVEIRQQIRLLLIDLIHSNKLIALQNEIVVRADSMELYFRRAAQAGSETRLDYNKSVVERIAAHRELHRLEGERELLLASLTALNGGEPVATLANALGTDYPQWPDVNSFANAEAVRLRDTEYAAAVAMAESSAATAKVERRLRLPGFSIGYEHEVEGAEVYNGITVGLSLPVWSGKRRAKAAILESQAASYEADAILARKLANIEADKQQMEALATIVNEYEPVVGNNDNLRLLQRAFEARQITFLTFITEYNYYLSARHDYYEALRDYNRAIVRLAQYL